MKRITLRIPNEVRDLLLAKSRDDHRSLSDTIRVIMTQYLGLKYRAKLDMKTNPELPLSDRVIAQAKNNQLYRSNEDIILAGDEFEVGVDTDKWLPCRNVKTNPELPLL